MTPFAPMAQNRSAPLAASPAMCRPSGSVFPRTLTGLHAFGPYIGQRHQACSGNDLDTPTLIFCWRNF